MRPENLQHLCRSSLQCRAADVLLDKRQKAIDSLVMELNVCSQVVSQELDCV